MKTNINLDEELVERAFKYATVTTKRDLVHLALQEFVNHHQRKDLRDLRERVTILEDYDHKLLRDGGTRQ